MEPRFSQPLTEDMTIQSDWSFIYVSKKLPKVHIFMMSPGLICFQDHKTKYIWQILVNFSHRGTANSYILYTILFPSRLMQSEPMQSFCLLLSDQHSLITPLTVMPKRYSCTCSGIKVQDNNECFNLSALHACQSLFFVYGEFREVISK